MEFRPLASSSQGNCYRVSAPGADPLLIDCGLRFTQIQVALDFAVAGLAGCLISHAHGDHCRAVRQLLASGVDCFASAETWAQLGEPFVALHRAHIVKAREECAIGAWRVLPFDVVHDVPTLGFLVDAPDGGRLAYISDTCYSKYRFEGVTIFAVEANFSTDLIRQGTASGNIGHDRFQRTVRNHMPIERLIEMLAANDLSKVEEIHLLHLSGANSDAEGFKKIVERATGKPVYVAGEVCV